MRRNCGESRGSAETKLEKRVGNLKVPIDRKAGKGGRFNIDGLSIDEAISRLSLVAVLVAMGGLLTAMFGVFVTFLWSACLVGGVLLIVVRFFLGINRSDRPHNLLMPTISLSVIAGWTIWMSNWQGFPVMLNRDPGSYLSTALWLRRSGNLVVDVSSHVLFGTPGVHFAGPASYEVGPGTLQFQFEHGSAVLYAIGTELFGLTQLGLIAVLATGFGLLAAHRILFRLHVPGMLSLGIVTVMALAVPVLYVNRSTYSEPFVFMLLMSATLQFLVWWESSRMRDLFILSLLVGGCSVFRVDGLIYTALLFALLVPIQIWRPLPKLLPVVLLGIGAPLLVGTVDHWLFTGQYATDLGDSYWPLLGLTVFCFTLAAISPTNFALTVWEKCAGLIRSKRYDHRSRLVFGWLTAATVLGAYAAGLYLRPRFGVDFGGRSGLGPSESLVAGLQQRAGLSVDSSRRYSELSLQYFLWYFGPLLAWAAGLGVALLMKGAVGRNLPRALALTVGVFMLPYLWRLRITPDQPWATRRLVPAVFPYLTLIGAWALSWLVLKFKAGVLRSLAGFVLTVGIVAPVLFTSRQTWEMSDQLTGASALQELCGLFESLPQSDVVEIGAGKLSGALRGGCSVEVGFVRTVVDLKTALDSAPTCPTVVTVGGKAEDYSSAGLIFGRIGRIESDLGQMPFQTLVTPVDRYDPPKVLTRDVWQVSSNNCGRKA